MRGHGQEGQASVEMMGVLPLVLLVGIALWQLALAGHTLWMAGNAARVAARAEAVGRDAERAARSALPEGLERGMDVGRGGAGVVEVRLRVPFVLHRWQTPIPVTARAHLQATS
jgi:pilus assembly protein CpaE